MTEKEATLISLEISRVVLTEKASSDAVADHLDLSDQVLADVLAWLESHMN